MPTKNLTASEITKLQSQRANGVAINTLCQLFGIGLKRATTLCVGVKVVETTKTGYRPLESLLCGLKKDEKLYESRDRGYRMPPGEVRHICRNARPTIYQLQARSKSLTITELYRSIEAAMWTVRGQLFMVCDPNRVDAVAEAIGNPTAQAVAAS